MTTIKIIPVPVVKQTTAKVVTQVKPHFTPEVGVFLLELHAVSREIPYFYYGTGMMVFVFSASCYIVRRVRSAI